MTGFATDATGALIVTTDPTGASIQQGFLRGPQSELVLVGNTGGGAVASVNGLTGAVVLDAAAVGAADASTVGKAMGLCIYTGSAYPARPTGFATVMWIGPVDPSTAASNGDLWVDNS